MPAAAAAIASQGLLAGLTRCATAPMVASVKNDLGEGGGFCAKPARAPIPNNPLLERLSQPLRSRSRQRRDAGASFGGALRPHDNRYLTLQHEMPGRIATAGVSNIGCSITEAAA